MGKKRRTRRQRREPMPSTLRLGILITVLVFIVVASGVLMFPGFAVDEIYCEGCVNTNPTDIISASRIEKGGNILLANAGRAEREISKMPLVDDVSVKRIFPDKICITVTECVPSAYIMAGVECVTVDKEGIVLEVINDERVSLIAKNNTPKSLTVQPIEDAQQKDRAEKSNEDAENEQTEEVTQDATEQNPQESEEILDAELKIYSIPLIGGIGLENVKEGRKAKATEPEKFTKLLEICDALNEAELLNRTTYIDISNLTDVKVFIENRLEVQIGTADNIGYRTKFLSEVINTKLSATEKAVMDYRGDDIYVRSPEDGKSRTVQEEEPEDTDDDTEKVNGDADDASETADEEEDEDVNVPSITL